MGRCGLVCDNTLEYEIVTANGDLVTANSEQNTDLFWALKGGGGNFGVVTSITYRLYPITNVISGMVLFPMAEARSVLRRYRDFVMAGLPDELIVYAGAVCTPEGVPVIAIVPAYCGDNLDEGERLLQPLQTFGIPLANLTSRMPYIGYAADDRRRRAVWHPKLLEVHLSARPARRSHRYIRRVRRAANLAENVSSYSNISTALCRVWPRMPLHSRYAPSRSISSSSPCGIARRMTSEISNGLAASTMRCNRGLPGIVYVNSLSEDDSARVPEAYGPNYARLCEVKAKYDPENRFRRNHNIRPKARAAQTPI